MDKEERGDLDQETIADTTHHDLSEDEILAQLDAPDDDGSAGPPKDEAPEEPGTTEPEDGKPPEEGTPEEEGTTPPEDEGKVKTGDPLKDTQRAFHEERRLRKEAEQREAGLKKELRELKAPKPPKFLNEEELEELRLNDYEAYVEARERQRVYDEQRAEWDRKIQEEDAAESQRLEGQALKNTFASFVEFAGEVLGVAGDPEKPFGDQPQEIQDFYKSPEFRRILDRTERHPHRYYESEGHITLETLRELHTVLNVDTIKQAEREAGRQEAAQRIDAAAKGGSKLDRVPQGQQSGGKPTDKLSQDEILELSEAEIASRLAEDEDA